MAENEKTTNDELKKLDLSSLPEKANVHIHMPGDEKMVMGRMKEPTPRRTVVGMITGAIGAIAGYAATALYINPKLQELQTDAEVAAREVITGRGAFQDGATSATSGATRIAGGVGEHTIVSANLNEFAKRAKYGKITNFIYKYLRGNSGAVVLAGAAAAGTVAAGAGYLLAGEDAPRKDTLPPELKQDKNWSERVDTAKDKPREIS